MPKADRTTIRATVDALITRLASGVVGDPPTPDKPFTRIVAGKVEPTSCARPFAAVAITGHRPVATIDGDRLFTVTLELSVVADIVDAQPQRPVLDLVAAVEDYMDSIVDTGVIEGASGFDDRDWAVLYPRERAGARVVSAVSKQSFVVRVERTFNRAAAP